MGIRSTDTIRFAGVRKEEEMRGSAPVVVLVVLLVLAIASLVCAVLMYGIREEALVNEIVQGKAHIRKLRSDLVKMPQLEQMLSVLKRAADPVAITPEGGAFELRGTKEETGIAASHWIIQESDEGTVALMRLGELGRTHVHDGHDVTLICITPGVRIDMGKRKTDVPFGSAIVIPRGTEHRLTSAVGDASIQAYVVTHPRLTKDFTRLVDPGESR